MALSVSPGHLDSILGMSFPATDLTGVSLQSQTGAAFSPLTGVGSYSTVTLSTTGVTAFGAAQDDTVKVTGINDTDNTVTFSETGAGQSSFLGTDFVVGYSSSGILLSGSGPESQFAELLPGISFQNGALGILSDSAIPAQTTLTFTPSATLPVPLPPPLTAVTLHGSSSQYIVANNNGSLYVQDTVAGRDGTQTLSGTNEIIFTDGTGIFDPTGTAEAVDRLYQATLGRAPDAAGLEFWTDQVDDSNVPLSAVAGSFAASPEFVQDFGSLSNADFVNRLYQNVLGRPADTAGAAFWDGQLATGTSRGTVALDLAESSENKADTVSTDGDEDNAEAFRLYQAALNRAPDAAGLAFWSATLANGATPAQVAQDFIASPEFQAKFGTLSASDFVSTLYQNVLHRAADPAGQQFWTNALQQGTSQASVLVDFSDGLENRIQTASATHANWVFIPS